MKKLFFNSVRVFFSILLIALASLFVAMFFETTVFTAVVAVVMVSLVANLVYGSYLIFSGKNPGRLVYDTAVELWIDRIIVNLWKDNGFMARLRKTPERNILMGSVVHVPKAGSKPTVVKNRSSFPATARRRADSDVTFALNDYTTDPDHVPMSEEMEINYDKMDDVVNDHFGGLGEAIAEDALYAARAILAGEIVRTSGTDAAAYNPHATAAVSRKMFVKENLLRAQTIMNEQNISARNRIAVLPSVWIEQLQQDDDLKKRDFGKEIDIKTGRVGQLYSFDIYQRSSVLTYTNATPPVCKAVDATAAATDNLAGLCIAADEVEIAIGDKKLFDDKGNPFYYGDIVSALVKAGAFKRRDYATIAIVQDGTYS